MKAQTHGGCSGGCCAAARRETDTLREALLDIRDYEEPGPQDPSDVYEHFQADDLAALALNTDGLNELCDYVPTPDMIAETETVVCQRCGAEHPSEPEVRTYSGCPECFEPDDAPAALNADGEERAVSE